MTNFDTCSVLPLIQSTYFDVIFDKNDDCVVKLIFEEVVQNEDTIILRLNDLFGYISHLPFSINFDDKTKFKEFIRNQFKRFKEEVKVEDFKHNVEQVKELIKQSYDDKLLIDLPETNSFLYSNSNNKNFVIDDTKAFIFFKTHRNCKIKIHLLYEAVLEKDIEYKQKIDILQILYELYYQYIKPNQREYTMDLKISYLKKLLGWGETETIKGYYSTLSK